VQKLSFWDASLTDIVVIPHTDRNCMCKFLCRGEENTRERSVFLETAQKSFEILGKWDLIIES